MHIIEILKEIVDEVKDDLIAGGVNDDVSNDYSFPYDSPYFDYGSWIEIDKNLIEKGNSPSLRNMRFPLIFVKLPITVEKNITSNKNYQTISNLDLFFFVETDEKKSTQYRNENNKQQIIKLTDAFFYRFKKHIEGELIIKETYIPYMEGVAFALSTPVDCIKITITDITISDLCLT